MLQVGIVGLPNVGKSTVFNALCQGGAKVSNYAFCTVEPNRAVVGVPDARLEAVARIFEQAQMVPASMQFVDIAGLVRGASKGEGLGNQFLAAIREVDAVLHVVRCFKDDQVSHVEGTIDPVRDIEIVEAELVLADLGAIERRQEKIASALKGRSADALREAQALSALSAHLQSGRPARTIANREETLSACELFLLTDKPVVYLANVGEEEGRSALYVDQLAGSVPGPVVSLSARLEADLAELEDAERADFVAELDLTTSGLEPVVRACYDALDLVTFFTGVGAEARAWAVPRGTTAAQAAAGIHSDMARRFIRAELIACEVLAELGSWQDAHRTGKVRTEGRDYVIQEGDVLLVRFSA